MRYFLRRPRAFWISVCNLVGLACSMVGVVLLFWYALPVEVPGKPEALLADSSQKEVQRYEARRQLYGEYAHTGLALVLIGTLLEALPPFCTALGSWKRRPIVTQPQEQEDTRPSQAPQANPYTVQDGSPDISGPPQSPRIVASAGTSAGVGSAKGVGDSWTLLSPQGVRFGFVLLAVGATIIWRLQDYRGIGEGLVSGSLAVLLANLLQWLQKKCYATGSRLADGFLGREPAHVYLPTSGAHLRFTAGSSPATIKPGPLRPLR